MAEQRIDVTPRPAVQRAHDQCFGKQQDLENPPGIEKLTPGEVEFIAQRDSFYLASVSETGWPYVQHHGGPPGFIRVLDPNLVGFADFKGNRQPVTTGKIGGADRVVLFLMDYPNRTRLKLMGHACVLDPREHSELANTLTSGFFPSKVERLFLIQIISCEWNSSQFITPRFTAAEVASYAAPLRTRIAELEGQIARGSWLHAIGDPEIQTIISNL
jgi:predicted pyridoxine 5'-phosphate oxidase superfamily flavin-nucleotide-binding protein